MNKQFIALLLIAVPYLLIFWIGKSFRNALHGRRLLRTARAICWLLNLSLLVLLTITILNPTTVYRDGASLLPYAYAGLVALAAAAVLAVALIGIWAIAVWQDRNRLYRAACHALNIWRKRRFQRRFESETPLLARRSRTLLPDEQRQVALGDHLGRDYMNALGRNQIRLDPFALDNGPKKSHATAFVLDDDQD